MTNHEVLSEFINAPTTVDFITQSSEFVLDYINEHPNIKTTTVLNGGYLVAYVNEDDVEQVISDLGFTYFASRSIVLGLVGNPALDVTGISEVQNLASVQLNLKGDGVLVGIVDTGIDYTLDVFKHRNGTSKIVSIFDQTGAGSAPYDFGFGVEYSQDMINTALNTTDPFSMVPVTDPSGHGTFLASVAAGSETNGFIGAAPEAELIVVKLKKASPFYLNRYLIPTEQEYAYGSADIMLGIQYILIKAKELKRPVAICLGLGTNFGGHDGQYLLESYLDGVSRIAGVCLCIAAGNEGKAKHHYLGTAIKQQTDDVKLSVGEDAGGIYLTMLNDAESLLSVSITSPFGDTLPRYNPSNKLRIEQKMAYGLTTVIIEYNYPVYESGSQLTIIKILNASPGIWTISVYGEYVVVSDYHIWLPMTGFVAPNVKFVNPNPNYTLTVPGTATIPITCGGYDSNNYVYENTSLGPTRLDLQKPDLVAPCVAVAGIYSGGSATMTGTSVAAAITTGASALMLQWGIIYGKDLSMGTNTIKPYLRRGATRFPDIQYPNFSWGYGLLNLINSFEAMME